MYSKRIISLLIILNYDLKLVTMVYIKSNSCDIVYTGLADTHYAPYLPQPLCWFDHLWWLTACKFIWQEF